MIPQEIPAGKLRLDGYYRIGEMDDPSAYVGSVFLYQNGVTLTLGAFLKREGAQRENLMRDTAIVNKARRLKTSWGVVNTTGDSIKLEVWSNLNGGDFTYIRKGRILNDTTFLIDQTKNLNDGTISDTDVVFHFVRFMPKPDSTNRFIQ